MHLPNKRWLGGGAAALAVGVVAAFFLRANHAKDLADPDRARRQGRPIPVRTALVERKEIEQVIGGTAITTASETALLRMTPSRGRNVTAPLSELAVKAVHAREGDAVTRGQLLFELEDEFYKAVVKQKEAALAAAQARLERVAREVESNQQVRRLDVESAKAGLEFRVEDLGIREREYGALKSLGKAATEFEVYDALSKYAQARYLRAEAERTLQRARNAVQVGELRDREDQARAQEEVETTRFELDVARRESERGRLCSPINGILDFAGKPELVAGQAVEMNVVLAQVLRLDPIHVRVDFPQDRIDEIAVGQKAEVVLDSFPKETFPGRVIRILPRVNPDLRVLPVVVELPNSGNRIKAGVSGFARFRISRSAMTVPAVAVLQHGERAMVFRVEAGRARARELRTGRLLLDGEIEVSEGLAAGEEVVVFHNFYRHAGHLNQRDCYLQDNDLVDTDWRKWARRD